MERKWPFRTQARLETRHHHGAKRVGPAEERYVPQKHSYTDHPAKGVIINKGRMVIGSLIGFVHSCVP